jgi:hypothetical protein
VTEASNTAVDPAPDSPSGDPAGTPGSASVGHHGEAHVPLAILTLMAAGLLAAGSVAGPKGLVASVAALQLALVGSWLFGSKIPGRIGAVVLGVGATVGVDVAAVRYHADGYGPMLGVLGVAVPLMFVHQLTRGVVRNRVLDSLTDITFMLVSVVAVAGLIVLRYQTQGPRIVASLAVAAGVAVAVDHLVDLMFPVARFDDAVDRGLPGVVLGVLAGGVVGLLMLRPLIDFTGGRGAFVGATTGAVGCLVSIGVSFAGLHSSTAWGPGESSGEPAWQLRLRSVAAVLLTLCLVTPAGYVLVNALTTT